MPSIRFGKLRCGRVLATAVSVSMLAQAARAYTAEEQQACSGDAFRLCSSEIPDVDRITACMVRRKSELSAGCRVYFGSGPEPGVTPVGVGKPLSIRPAGARKPVSAKPDKAKKATKPSDT